MTVLDHIVSVLNEAATYNRHDLTRPSVILWTDGDRHWEKVAQTIAQARRGFWPHPQNLWGNYHPFIHISSDYDSR